MNVLEEGTDYFTFQSELKKELDNLGCDLVKMVLEALEEKIRESKDRKQYWKIVRRNDRKEILTPFGPVVYKRSYYRHKESKHYTHLVNDKVGITPHARVDSNLKAQLVEASAGMSYEKATVEISYYNASLKVSKQT